MQENAVMAPHATTDVGAGATPETRSTGQPVAIGANPPGVAARARQAITDENAAIEEAVAAVVGHQEAERLIELGKTLRAVEARPDKPANATQRALDLMETAEGRAQLATLTWDTV